MKIIKNYINGKLIDSKNKRFLDVYNPSNGSVYAQVPDSEPSDVNKAVEAAKDAFDLWSLTKPEERHEYLIKISDSIINKLEDLALAESIDNGKPLWLSKSVDIPRSASNFKFFATSILHFTSESHQMVDQAINYTLRKPLGVVGCISPWNLPLYLFSWKIAPALAAGNTVVAKPSEVTPMTAYLLSEICIEIGLPKGVLNIVHGQGQNTGAILSIHKEVKAISFTGSTRVGKEIAKQAAPLFKKYSLEMGGKNPNIIFADCDYDKMLKTTVQSSFRNQGQICLCGSKILIERSVYDRFKKDFITEVRKLKVGNPLDDTSEIGAIVSKNHYDKVMYYINLAKEEGGEILVGGNTIKPKGLENGWYIEPTVIEGLNATCRVNQEEVFGPVVTIMPFENEQEAIKIANNSEYGLSTTLWTQDLTRAHNLADKIQSGILWINTWMLRDLRTPFGGMKNSGVGREGGYEALRFFTEQKNICVEYK